jgi:hypothetical protein
MRPSKDPRARLRAWLLDGVLPRPADAGDARALAFVAVRHGLAAWLDEALPASDPAWPEPLREELKQAHRRSFFDATQRLDLARRIQSLLDAQGLRVLPLKGAALSESLYPSPAHRPMADVDMLALDRPEEARRALAGAGFQEIAGGDHAWVFEDAAGAGVVELHHSVTSCPGLFPIDVDSLWRQSRRTSSGLRVPSIEHLLVQLGLHAAFQHGLVLSLVQYLDFRRLLEGPLDVDAVLLHADAARARDALSLALGAAEAVIGAQAPAQLMGRAAAKSWFLRLLRDPMALLEPSPPGLGRVRWACVPGQRLLLLRRTLAGPSEVAESGWARGWRGLGRAVRLARRSVS